ncbi:hypothetical protein RT41_GL000832 [Lactococcus fujiensis JCM 16395]|uniref:Uncharacterized protein n=2 Tax=Lactococcus fujiensis TaxID=610251 RepID=A0A2A5RNV1_9LACT|nr:hypothetical protein RT41_GL000832 [Lactococcus fujiensis JCM 16395]
MEDVEMNQTITMDYTNHLLATTSPKLEQKFHFMVGNHQTEHYLLAIIPCDLPTHVNVFIFDRETQNLTLQYLSDRLPSLAEAVENGNLESYFQPKINSINQLIFNLGPRKIDHHA